MDDHSAKLASSIILEVFKSVLPGVKDWFTETLLEKDFLGRAAKKYANTVYDRYNTVRIFGMSEDVPLKDLFIKVNILQTVERVDRLNLESFHKQMVSAILTENQRVKIAPELAKYLPETSLPSDYDEFKESVNESLSVTHFNHILETTDAMKVVSKGFNLIVLGKPGAGKTTFLKYILLQSLESSSLFVNRRIPVLITLKNYSESGLSLIEYITKQLEIGKVKHATPFIEHLLGQGKCLLLFDGLDEVSDNYLDKVIRTVSDFADQFSDNQMILSCRSAAYGHWFSRFKEIELADFDSDQIQAFVKNWFRKEPKIGVDCWQGLKDNSRILELASTPLLLTLFCIAFDEALRFPPSRAETYEVAIDALLKKWDLTRRIIRSSPAPDFPIKRQESLYSIVAMKTFQESQYFIPLKILTKILDDYFQKWFDDANSIDVRDVLSNLEAAHGILIERSKKIYSFSHLSIQEYFTARFIEKNSSNGTLERLIVNYMWDVRWREVFLITANMLFNSDDFIDKMFKHLSGYTTQHSELSGILREIEIIAENFQNDFGVRGLILINFISHCHAYKKWMVLEDEELDLSVNVLLGSAHNQALLLFRKCFKNSTAPFLNKIHNASRTHERAERIINDHKLLSRLKDFIYGINLIVDCMDSELSIQRKSEITERLLTIQRSDS